MTSRLSDLRPLLHCFIETNELSEGLYEAALSAAVGVIKSVKQLDSISEKDERVRDLTMDFLVNRIKAAGLSEIKSVAGLQKEMRRYYTTSMAPESRELWESLSRAIRELAAGGKVQRFDADWQHDNSSIALWGLPESDGQILDMNIFREAAGALPVYPKERRHMQESSLERATVLTPTDAKELILGLLEAARAPITFKLLCDEAKLHVVMRMAVQESLEWKANGGGMRICSHLMAKRSDVALWVADEAPSRASQIWEETLKAEGDDAVLCCYFLPKHFGGLPVTMADFDEPAQRISERAIRIKRCFAVNLRLDRISEDHPDNDGDPFNDALAALIERVAKALLEKCAERFPESHFYKDKPQ